MLRRSRKARLIALILTSFLIVGMAELAWSQQPLPAAREETPNQPENKETPQAEETTADEQSASVATEDQSRREVENKGQSSWYDQFVVSANNNSGAITAVATAVIALFTVALTWLGCRQFLDSRILQRAYVGVDPGGVRLWSDNKQLVAHVLIKNAGNLPASEVKWTIYLEPDISRERKNFPIVESDIEGSHFIVPRGTLRVRPGTS